MKHYFWLVRREFWENKAIVVIPALVGAALLLATLFGRVQIWDVSSPDQHRAVSGTLLFAFGAVFIIPMVLYSVWYLLDCLYADRKDKSVLFWKSLPISDTATVLSKLFFGLIAIPVVYFAIADLCSVVMAIILYARSRSLIAALWQPAVWLQIQILWLYIIATAALWYLPVAGWLLLVSAWAKRAVILWSILPPLGVVLAERLFKGTLLIGQVLFDRLAGYPASAFQDIEHRAHWIRDASGDAIIGTTSSVWSLIDPAGFLASPAVWIGVILGAAMIGGAIQLRMRRAD